MSRDTTHENRRSKEGLGEGERETQNARRRDWGGRGLGEATCRVAQKGRKHTCGEKLLSTCKKHRRASVRNVGEKPR